VDSMGLFIDGKGTLITRLVLYQLNLFNATLMPANRKSIQEKFI